MGNSLDPEELIVLMNRNIKEYRFHLGKELQLKYVPQIKFYHDKMDKLISGLKTPSVVVQKKMMVNETLRYLSEREEEFKAMIALYRDIQHIKTLVIDKLDPLEKYRTYILKEGRYEVTRPEGYVLHRDEDMVKFVDRLEFSKNNFLGGSFQT